MGLRMKYHLKIIPGTGKWVKDELLEKHSGVLVVKNFKDSILFESEENIDCFRDLMSCLRITTVDGKITRNLFRRQWRLEFVPAGVNPALAYVLCRIAQIESKEVVLDPFCGAGTIAISSGLYFGPKMVIASDISGKAIDKTKKNIESSGLKRIMVFASDVGRLKLGKNSVDKIVTNLPFGIRVSDSQKNEKIYSDFLKMSKRVLKSDGVAVALTMESRLLKKIAVENGFGIVGDFEVEQGGLLPHIFVLKTYKKTTD